MRALSSFLGRTLALLAFFACSPTLAAGSLLLWPLDPTIEAGAKAGALWLENVGTKPLTLQVRVFAWDQQAFEDRYLEQSVVVGTPPFTTIAPGKKQLVRLTLAAPIPPGEERAFRVLVDEIPTAETATTTGLKLQMRYSLPLFAYGEGLWGKSTGRKLGAVEAQPKLAWSFVEEGGVRYLQVRNAGRGHARLSQVKLVDSSRASGSASGASVDIAKGLLGYVLPGKTMRWPAPADVVADGQLLAQLDTNAPLVTLPNE
jgi:fimbrial chaperone protein